MHLLRRHALRGVEVVWVVRNDHIGDAFFDLDAAAFLFSEIDNDVRAGSDGARPASLDSLVNMCSCCSRRRIYQPASVRVLYGQLACICCCSTSASIASKM